MSIGKHPELEAIPAVGCQVLSVGTESGGEEVAAGRKRSLGPFAARSAACLLHEHGFIQKIRNGVLAIRTYRERMEKADPVAGLYCLARREPCLASSGPA